MTDQQRLLTEYAASGSEAAFRELVACYLDLVHSTAVRLVEGDTHRAQDVTQTVFADLARVARTLSSGVRLGGWLHRHTCYVAATMLRGERRRQFRERQAAEMNALQDHSEANLALVAPILDDAINQLGDDDRTAILLRFFERSDFRAIGETLGSNEDAAQKRVTRALEKLHALLKHRGVTFSAAALGSALTAGAVTAAPAGLAISVSGAALAGAAGVGASLGILNLMTMTKLKFGIISAVVAVGVGTPLVMQHQAQVKLRGENLALRQQLDELTALKAENERLASLLAQSQGSQSLAEERLSELLKLRNAVATLRAGTNALGRLQAENRRLQASLAQARQKAAAPSETPSATDFPRDKWEFAGYGTPEAAAQTMAWAAMNGDVGIITNSVTPELKQMLDGLIQQGRFEKDFLAGMAEDVKGMSAFKILTREVLTDDQIQLTVSIPGKNDRHPILKKIGDEWKFVRFN